MTLGTQWVMGSGFLGVCGGSVVKTFDYCPKGCEFKPQHFKVATVGPYTK